MTAYLVRRTPGSGAHARAGKLAGAGELRSRAAEPPPRAGEGYSVARH